MYVDAHVHCVELRDLDKYVGSSEIKLACVSDDLDSTYRVLEYKHLYSDLIVPCIGIHPWIIHEYRVSDIERVFKEFIDNEDIACIGEVGLDKRFRPETYEKQVEFFSFFVRIAKEHNLALNLHTAGTWREVFEIIHRNDIDKAYFHWYTGPLELLDEIKSVGYYIGINPAWMIQEKHRAVIERADLSIMITESDAPYSYRGIELSPSMVKDTVEYISKIKRTELVNTKEIIWKNFRKLFSL